VFLDVRAKGGRSAGKTRQGLELESGSVGGGE
jgi:hypothetical protein